MTTWSSNDPKGIHALSPGNNGTERCYWHPTHTKCGSPSITRGCGILIAIFLCLGWLETQNCLEYLWRCAWCTVSCSDISWLNKFRFYKLFLKYINELRHIPSNLQDSSFVEMRCVLDALPCGGRWQCGCLDSMDTERERERERELQPDGQTQAFAQTAGGSSGKGWAHWHSNHLVFGMMLFDAANYPGPSFFGWILEHLPNLVSTICRFLNQVVFLAATVIGKGTTAGLPTCPTEPTAMPGDWESFRNSGYMFDWHWESEVTESCQVRHWECWGWINSTVTPKRVFRVQSQKPWVSMRAGTYTFCKGPAFNSIGCLKSSGPCLRRTFQSFYTHSWNVARMVPPNARPANTTL